ncbi:MAG: hypothetical protein K8W52_37375 [Deltaproteobacteria bacterium]|nr:hypothetical protein [Deltaproteobacteria bacterium]
MMQGLTRRIAIAAVAVALMGGCEKTNHENIDKWMGTQNGPDKLAKAMTSGDLEPDLSAHAAANLIKMGKDTEVRAAIEGLPADRRTLVVAKLTDLLKDLARIEGEMTMPSALQVSAKDVLFDMRKLGDEPTRQAIDAILMDWYTGGYYEGRASLGRHLGATVVRVLGAPAGDKLTHAANVIIAQPAKGNVRTKVGDELLLAMAASGNPESVKYVLDIYHMDRGDPTLAARCASALYRAYVDPGGLFDVADPAALVPSLDRIVEVAQDESQPPGVTNDAVALIRAAGMPSCLDPLVRMIPNPDRQRRWVGANNALKCGGVKAIAPVAAALAPDSGYDREELSGAVFEEIAKMTPRDQVVTEARTLLDSPSWVSRWIGVEVLALVKSKEDAPRLSKLAGDKSKLAGYWGAQEGVDPKAKKVDPTLGARAAELAAALAK